ncbi:MAG: hypothetical protein R3E39_27625 [Anaerolineae bacterium]
MNFDDINLNGIADANEPRGILPNRVYEVRIDAASNFAAGGPLENYFYYGGQCIAGYAEIAGRDKHSIRRH